jgi:mannosyltransferase OCH1-like enzyme
MMAPPRLLHVIWVGTEPLRWVRTNWALWHDALPEGVELVPWTNEEARSAFPELVARFDDRGGDRRVLPDLLRLELVHRFGGVYVDSDTVPLRALEDLWAPREAGAWVGAQDGWQGHQGLLNSAFGAVPGHPFVGRVLASGYANLERGLKSPHHIAGPVVFKNVWREGTYPIDVLSGFNMTYDRHNVRQMRMCEPDLEALRVDVPNAPLAHVGVAYGKWTQKELEANSVA